MSNKLHASTKDKISSEMYLKTIFLLKENLGKNPKPIDIVRELELSKGSVSEMLKKLDEEGLIEYESYKRITLTSKGVEAAKNVVRKYLIIKRFLKEVLKVDEEKLHEEACSLEHAFSDESIAKLNIFLKLIS